MLLRSLLDLFAHRRAFQATLQRLRPAPVAAPRPGRMPFQGLLVTLR
ncbi:hypothetical protein [Roseateles sp.]|nr:hypothetical protein [Roseateles sp.]MBV8036551.1 hypothetical protein [Roseateles sp.]